MVANKRNSRASETNNKPDPNPYEWEFAKPPHQDLSSWQRTKLYLYDSETNKILGRTPKGWGQILVFYSCFYAVLAALFALCMKGLMTTISYQYPVYTLDESLIGTNPGMGFRPMPPNIEEGSVIWYLAKNKTNTQYWVDSLNEFLEGYHEQEKIGNTGRQICDYDKPPAAGKACAVDLSNHAMGPCTQKNHYGFQSSSPCIFLKLNRIYGWVPEYYNSSDSLPEEMPDDLKEYIKLKEKEKDKKMMLNTVWVSCHGEGPPDNEFVGPIEYYPQPGFPGYFYPYMNSEGYLSPLVAVHFKRPMLNRLINIECRVWAKNVFYGTSPQGREGSVHFEIMID